MFVSILSLVCMYSLLVPLSSALLLFVLRKVYLDFYPEEETPNHSDEIISDKMNGSGDVHSSETNQSGSTSSHKSSENPPPISPRQRSVSSVKSAKWAASEIDSVMCGLNRWGYFVLTTDIAIIICCLCTLVSALILLLMFVSVAPCSPSGPTVASIYQVSKGSMYFIFLNRVDNIFVDTPFAYSKLLIRSLMAVNFCGSLCLSIATLAFIGVDSASSHGLTWCFPLMPPLVGVSMISFDILMSGISMHLFISPLRKIYAMEVQSQMENVPAVSPVGASAPPRKMKQLKKNSQLRRIAVKCRLLTCTAIVSTFVMFSVAVLLDFGDFVVWDQLINNLSIVFMTTWLDDYYEYVCCVPIMIESCLKSVCSSIKK